MDCQHIETGPDVFVLSYFHSCFMLYRHSAKIDYDGYFRPDPVPSPAARISFFFASFAFFVQNSPSKAWVFP